MRTHRRRSSALFGVLLLTAAALLGGCGRAAAPRFGVVHRLVDAAIRERAVVHPPVLATRDDTTFASQTSAVARIPAATIGGDTRSVMAAYPVTWGGSQWHCMAELTKERPGGGSPDWVLAVKQGDPGKPGKIESGDRPAGVVKLK